MYNDSNQPLINYQQPPGYQQPPKKKGKGLIIALIILGAVLLLGSAYGLFVAVTSSNTGILASSSTPPEGYLSQDEDGVRFLKFVTNGSNLSGTWQGITLSERKLTYPSGALTGVLNGENISITLTYLGFQIPTTGTLKDNTLTLNTPGPDGNTKQAVYHGALEADYTTAFNAFKAAHQ
jgi:hypothetical protein